MQTLTLPNFSNWHFEDAANAVNDGFIKKTGLDRDYSRWPFRQPLVIIPNAQHIKIHLEFI